MSSFVSITCCTCLSDSSSYHHLSDHVDENYKIVDMLDSIVPQISIKNSSRFSTLIMCQMCVNKLLNGYKFQQLCIESNNRLQDLFGSRNFKMEPDHLTGESIEIQEDTSEFYSSSHKLENEPLSDNHNDWFPNCSGGSNTEESFYTTRSHTKKKRANPCNTRFMSEEIRKADTLTHKKSDVAIKKIDNFATPKLFDKLKGNVNEKEELKYKNINELLTFQCPDCPFSFEKKASLSAHFKIHTKKNFLKNTKSNTNPDMQNVEKNTKSNTNPDMQNVEKEKMDEIMEVSEIIKEEYEIYEERMDYCVAKSELKNAYDDSYEKQEKELLPRPGENKSINMDLIDASIGEVEKPNSGRKIKAPFPCEVCGKIFDRPSRLKRHSSVHSMTRPHECTICKHRFPTTNILQAHMFHHKNATEGNINTLSRPEGFKCPHCPRRFEKQASLSAHQRLHKYNSSEANYICTICERNFMSIKTLTEHIANIHPEVEKHKCVQCDKAFVLHVQLLEHLNHHKDNRNLMCLICEEQFEYKIMLKKHLRTHSIENSYMCPKCGKTFCSVSNVRFHMERHFVLKN